MDETKEKSTNGASKGIAPLSEELEAYERYFGRPITLQLRHPALIVDLGGKVEVDGHVYGVAEPLADDNKPVASPVIGGILQPDPTGRYLIVYMQTQHAIMEYRIDPADVIYVTSVARMAETSPIVRP